MRFLLKPMLGTLILVPLLVVGYVALVRRRTRRADELAAKGFAPTAAALRLRKRRHIPFVFFLSGLTVLLSSLARPATTVSVPNREGTVILAFDVSNSMRATDLTPTRMAAAKAAAKGFVGKQPTTIKIGVVAFNDGGVITQQPTKDKTQVLAAIDRLTPSGGTSLGQGIFTSLNAIAGKPIAIDLSKLSVGPDGPSVDIGYFGSAAIVLLSDGENTGEPSPTDVAKLASVAGVTIYPIGIGSADGTVVQIDGFSISTALDQDGLTEIAKVSNGRYFSADNATSLASIYKTIDLHWHNVKQHTEITGVLTALSTALLLVGAALSLLWFGRVV
jgi:Ca-activated chloride channel homolog